MSVKDNADIPGPYYLEVSPPCLKCNRSPCRLHPRHRFQLVDKWLSSGAVSLYSFKGFIASDFFFHDSVAVWMIS
jgi:hypothetical protein